MQDSACMQQTAHVCFLWAEEVLRAACLAGALKSIVMTLPCLPLQGSAPQLGSNTAFYHCLTIMHTLLGPCLTAWHHRQWC